AIIENIILYQKAQTLAITDELTGLYLYFYFYERLDYDIKRIQKKNSILTVLMIEIDNFKKINDTYSYAIGDEILIQSANIFKKCIRNVDLIARYGGDEFAIILSETSKEGAFITAERIRTQIEKTSFIIEEHNINITVSIGIASCPENAITAKELVDKADKAMYIAKKIGKNEINIFEEKNILEKGENEKK
ncbi:MAG: GGDEF domain-containing protein, partial [bacterium]